MPLPVDDGEPVDFFFVSRVEVKCVYVSMCVHINI